MTEFEPECTFLGNLFQTIVSDLKSNSAVWEDVVNRGFKLQQSLKATYTSMNLFHESLQKIADNITNTKGSTKEIGSALTRICVRQRMVETKLKQYIGGLQELFIMPIGNHLEEWKKISNWLEKEHTKETKKHVSEIKKKSAEVARMKKKMKKVGRTELVQQQLVQMSTEVNDRVASLETIERTCLRNLLVEERTRACFYALNLSQLLNLQVSIGEEASTIQDLSTDLTDLCRNPKQLPAKVDDIIQDYINVHNSKNNNSQQQQQQQIDVVNMTGTIKRFNFRSPPASPPTTNETNNVRTTTSTSHCSLNSIGGGSGSNESTLSRTSSFQFNNYRHQVNLGNGVRQRSASVMGDAGGSGHVVTSSNSDVVTTKPRLSSISSHDSGFISHHHHHHNTTTTTTTTTQFSSSMDDVVDGGDQTTNSSSGKPLTPSTVQLELDEQSIIRGAETISSRPTSWKDWSRPGPYELMAAAQHQQHPTSVRSSSISSNTTSAAAAAAATNHFCSQTLDGRHYSTHHHQQVLPNKMSTPPALSPKPASMIHMRSAASTDELDVFQFPPTQKPPGGSCNSVYSGDSEATDGTLLAEEMKEAFQDMINMPLPPPPSDMLSNHPATPTLPPRPEPISGHFSSATLGRKLVGSHYSSSSGYSSQNTTPACSQDTIASHETDLSSMDGSEEHSNTDNSSDRFSTMPRIRGYPNGGTLSRRSTTTTPTPASQLTNATATIRRKPTGKYGSVRRTPSGLKAVTTPTVPPPMTAINPSTYNPFASVFAQYDTMNHNSNNNNNISCNNNQQSDQFSLLTRQFKQSVQLQEEYDVTLPLFPDLTSITDDGSPGW